MLILQSRPAATAAVLILTLTAASLPARAVDDAPTLTWRAEPPAVVVSMGGREVFTLEAPGPSSGGEGRRIGPADSRLVGRPAVEARGSYTYRRADGAGWTVQAVPDGTSGFRLEMTSADRRFDRAGPGQVRGGGPWIALNLSQYALAHGQSHWPKTYYLSDSGLFVCVWWDLEVSNASRAEWDEAVADQRNGTGPFAPAATMRYVDGPDHTHAPLRESLRVRVARRLWDAALPSLCRPSEYREEMARLVFLDDWSGQNADDLRYLLNALHRLAAPHVGFLTILENWQAGGFDSLLPDSITMPDYPPSPAVGSVESLREAAALGRSLGRFGFRTNYMLLRSRSPSRLRGQVDYARDADGRPAWYTQPSRWADLARRQESEIAPLFRPNASFTDQLGSGGSAVSYLDFNRSAGGDGTIASALARQRALAGLIKETHQGPLGTETLNQQDLMGAYCDFGDFGVMGGHDRLFSPEYKLRRLHDVTVSYGCGLYYRFFELPPFPAFHANRFPLWKDRTLMDDYRCCEVLLGNGGYVMWPCPWSYALTEAIVIGRLQRRYALAPVRSVEYQSGSAWASLEDLVRRGFCPETRPWNQKQAEFGRLRVTYADGLTVVGNRLPGELTVATPKGHVVLPRYGWVAYDRAGGFRAGSAVLPEIGRRVDFLEEGGDGLRYLDPRGETIEGSARLRLWRGRTLLWSVDPDAGTATLSGESFPLSPPKPLPLTGLSFDFRRGLLGWVPAAGILRAEVTGDGVRLAPADDDPQLHSPPLALTGRAGDVIRVSLSTTAGRLGQLYFATDADGMSQRQELQFPLTPDGQPHTVTIPVGAHPAWPNRRITAVRLDPVHGAPDATVVLQSLRLERSP